MEEEGQRFFASILSFEKNKIKFYDGMKSLITENLYLGKAFFLDDPFQRHVGVHDDAHLMTIGMTGSGKAATSAFPNLAMYQGSMIVIDPKGEHSRTTFKRRYNWHQDTDYAWDMGIPTARWHNRFRNACYMLDPYGVNADTDLPACKYNPLADIPLGDEATAIDMISSIADGCVIPETKDTHFSDHARKFIFALIGHVLTEYPEENHNLPFVYDLFYGVNPENGCADPEAFENLLLDMMTNEAFGNKINAAGRDLMEMGENEKGSVLSTISKSLGWIAEPSMREQLSGTDLSLRNFGTKEWIFKLYNVKRDYWSGKYKGREFKFDIPYSPIETLYIVLPFGKMADQSRWLRVLSAVSIQMLTTRDKKPDIPTVFLLDEFAQLGGKIQAVVNAFNIARSAGIKLWIMLQHLEQIQKQYKEWNDMVSGSTVQLFGVNDMTTAKYFSERLGNMTVQLTEKSSGRSGFRKRRIVSENIRPLFAPDELIEILGKEDNTQIVFPTTGRPMLLERLGFIKIPFKNGGGTMFKPIKTPQGKGIRSHFSLQEN